MIILSIFVFSCIAKICIDIVSVLLKVLYFILDLICKFLGVKDEE